MAQVIRALGLSFHDVLALGDAEKDEGLRFPLGGKVQFANDDLGAKERTAQPTGTQPRPVSCQKKVLNRECRALNGHRMFRRGALRVGVDLGILQGEACQDNCRRLAQACLSSRGACEGLAF